MPVDVINGATSYPIFLPDGRHSLYTASAGGPDKAGVRLSSLDGEDRRILADAIGVVFAPGTSGRVGHVFFVRDNTLMRQPFDTAKFETSGDPLPVAGSVLSFIPGGAGYIPAAVSEDGILIFGGSGPSQLVWFDRDGNKLPGSLSGSAAFWEPSISPDERAIAFRRQMGTTTDIWLRDLDRGSDTRLSSNGATNLDPFWSPNGDRRQRRKTGDRTEGPEPLFQTRIGEGSGHVAFQYDVTADGKRFVVATTSGGIHTADRYDQLDPDETIKPATMLEPFYKT